MTRIIYTRLLLFLTIFNANCMLAMDNKVYKIEKNYYGQIQTLFLHKGDWVKNTNTTIDTFVTQNTLTQQTSTQNSIIVVTNNKDLPLAMRLYNEKKQNIYNIQKDTTDNYNESINITKISNTKTTFESFLEEIKDLQKPEEFVVKNCKQIPVQHTLYGKPTTSSFKIPDAIKSLTPRKNLSVEILDQLFSYEGQKNKPLYRAILAETLLCSLAKNYLLDKWVASIQKDDIFFTLATALQKSNSNLSIFGFKGILGTLSFFYNPKLLQDNNFYLNHHHPKVNGKRPSFSPTCCPPSAIKQVVATQLLGLAYQNSAPEELKDGWISGPVGQFVFEQAAITAARTNPYGVWSLIGAELIAGYSPNVT